MPAITYRTHKPNRHSCLIRHLKSHFTTLFWYFSIEKKLKLKNAALRHPYISTTASSLHIALKVRLNYFWVNLPFWFNSPWSTHGLKRSIIFSFNRNFLLLIRRTSIYLQVKALLILESRTFLKSPFFFCCLLLKVFYVLFYWIFFCCCNISMKCDDYSGYRDMINHTM